MGLYLSKNYENLLITGKDIMINNINHLKQIYDSGRTQHNITYSIEYLKKNEVIETFEKYILRYKLMTFRSRVVTYLGIVYIEMDAKNNYGKLYKVCFWPCNFYPTILSY